MDLNGLTTATEKELLDYLASEIVGRMNTLPADFAELFRPGTTFRQMLYINAANSIYPPVVDFTASDKGLTIRFLTADGVLRYSLFFAFADA